MKRAQVRKLRTDQQEITLERFFHNVSLVKDIQSYRKKIGVPVLGFNDFWEYFHFLGKENGSTLYFDKIKPYTLKISKKYGVPSNFMYWIEAFLVLDFNYDSFEPWLPFTEDKQRDNIAQSTTCSLDILFDEPYKKDYIVLKIYPGATQNSVKDFITENWRFMNSILKEKMSLGKTTQVRKVTQRDKLKILELADKKEIDSYGVWHSSEKSTLEVRPDCIEGIGPEQIKKIIVEERRKRKIHELGSVSNIT
jgi:hypothetical protein